MLFPYSNSLLALLLSKETNESFSDDFVNIYTGIASALEIMSGVQYSNDASGLEEVDRTAMNEGERPIV